MYSSEFFLHERLSRITLSLAAGRLAADLWTNGCGQVAPRDAAGRPQRYWKASSGGSSGTSAAVPYAGGRHALWQVSFLSVKSGSDSSGFPDPGAGRGQ